MAGSVPPVPRLSRERLSPVLSPDLSSVALAKGEARRTKSKAPWERRRKPSNKKHPAFCRGFLLAVSNFMSQVAKNSHKCGDGSPVPISAKGKSDWLRLFFPRLSRFGHWTLDCPTYQSPSSTIAACSHQDQSSETENTDIPFHDTLLLHLWPGTGSMKVPVRQPTCSRP